MDSGDLRLDNCLWIHRRSKCNSIQHSMAAVRDWPASSPSLYVATVSGLGQQSGQVHVPTVHDLKPHSPLRPRERGAPPPCKVRMHDANAIDRVARVSDW